MDPGVLAERMAAELFELAAARPIRFEPDLAESGERAGRVVAVAEPVPGEPAAPLEAGDGSAARMPPWVTRLLESGPGSIVLPAIRGRWAVWSVRRQRAMLAAAAAGVALVVAIAVVPGPAASVSAPPVPLSNEPGTPADDIGVGPDDPLAALHELTTRRDTCFRDLSVLCLDGVDEAGSSAWEADRAALRAVIEGGDAPSRLPLTSATLVERLGDSALVDLGPDSDPASILLLKGEAGWRIRDYLAPVGGEAEVG
jgi:hypothetical protein